MLKTALLKREEESEEDKIHRKARRIRRYSELINNSVDAMMFLPKEDEEGRNGLKEIINRLSELLKREIEKIPR